jgi:hypothetical protein
MIGSAIFEHTESGRNCGDASKRLVLFVFKTFLYDFFKQ